MPPHDDALDAMLYSREYLMKKFLEPNPIYLTFDSPEDKNHWIKENYFNYNFTDDKKENNIMYECGELRKHLKNIYGNADPLDYIDDAEVTMCADPSEAYVRLILRIPACYNRFVNAGIMPKQIAYNTVGLGQWSSANPGLEIASIERIHFSGDKTIIIWKDGSKTIVSCGEGEQFDEYTGFCAGLVKKLFGSTTAAKRFLNKVRVESKPKKVKKIKPGKPEEVVYEAVPETERHAVSVGDCMVATDIPSVDVCSEEDC